MDEILFIKQLGLALYRNKKVSRVEFEIPKIKAAVLVGLEIMSNVFSFSFSES